MALVAQAVSFEPNRETDMTHLDSLSPEVLPLDAWGIATYPLEGKIPGLLTQKQPAGWQPSGLDRTFYLDLMEPVIRMAASWVSESGALIDPVIGREWAQSTPRFVSSAAILLYFDRIPELQDIVFCSMTYCCTQLAAPQVLRDRSADFWMRELATAYDCLKEIAPQELVAQWKTDLARVRPESAYLCVDATHRNLERFHNWAVYSSAGESMRDSAGIGGATDFLWGNRFFEVYMAAQTHRFTTFGMYRDPADPITYDITTRLQFAAAIARGYEGPMRDKLGEVLRRGNLTMLLFVSPDGFVPFGGRSAQFNFQETIVCALSELEARRYRNADPVLAGAFKRQAHLSARAIVPWFSDCNPIRHIKNRFDPKTKHGCDTYGQYSVYSMLATSYLGLAALYADDTIAEQPTPSELGNYSLTLSPAFHKVFLCANGTYVEIDTQADPDHDATGIGRVLFKGLPPGFPLGMPFSAKPKHLFAKGTAAPVRPVALGPVWQRPDGSTDALAEWSTGVVAETTEHKVGDRVDGVSIRYRKGDTQVVEDVRIDADKVLLCWAVEIDGTPVRSVEITVPILIHDGGDHARIEQSETDLMLVFGGKTVAFRWSGMSDPRLEAVEIANRHGVYRILRLVAESGPCHLSIEAVPGKLVQ